MGSLLLITHGFFGALSRFDSICYSEFASSAAEIKLTTFLSGLGSRSFRLIKRMAGHVLSALARFSHFVFIPVISTAGILEPVFLGSGNQSLTLDLFDSPSKPFDGEDEHRLKPMLPMHQVATRLVECDQWPRQRDEDILNDTRLRSNAGWPFHRTLRCRLTGSVATSQRLPSLRIVNAGATTPSLTLH